jgi:hypothetical protein
LIWPEKISASPPSVAESGHSTHKNPEYQVSRARAVEEIFYYSNVTPFYHCPALPISMLM